MAKKQKTTEQIPVATPATSTAEKSADRRPLRTVIDEARAHGAGYNTKRTFLDEQTNKIRIVVNLAVDVASSFADELADLDNDAAELAAKHNKERGAVSGPRYIADRLAGLEIDDPTPYLRVPGERGASLMDKAARAKLAAMNDDEKARKAQMLYDSAFREFAVVFGGTDEECHESAVARLAQAKLGQFAPETPRNPDAE